MGNGLSLSDRNRIELQLKRINEQLKYVVEQRIESEKQQNKSVLLQESEYPDHSDDDYDDDKSQMYCNSTVMVHFPGNNATAEALNQTRKQKIKDNIMALETLLEQLNESYELLEKLHLTIDKINKDFEGIEVAAIGQTEKQLKTRDDVQETGKHEISRKRASIHI